MSLWGGSQKISIDLVIFFDIRNQWVTRGSIRTFSAHRNLIVGHPRFHNGVVVVFFFYALEFYRACRDAKPAKLRINIIMISIHDFMMCSRCSQYMSIQYVSWWFVSDHCSWYVYGIIVPYQYSSIVYSHIVHILYSQSLSVWYPCSLIVFKNISILHMQTGQLQRITIRLRCFRGFRCRFVIVRPCCQLLDIMGSLFWVKAIIFH